MRSNLGHAARVGAASSFKGVYAAFFSARLGAWAMSRFTLLWKRFRLWPGQHRAQLRLCLRVTASAVCALAVAHLLNLPLPLWTVLTAVLLTQISVGRSLKATMDYLASTLGGAVYAGAVGTLIPHTNEIALLGALALAVAPAVLVAAANPRFSATPFSAVMVFFGPTITHAGPIASAVERVIEVAVGAVVGLLVSFFVLPGRARELVVDVAARMLELMARALPELCAGLTGSLDASAIRRIQDPLGEALARLNAIAPELRHEQITRFADAPDPGPLLRTLLRLRHDLVMVGRAAVVPLAESVRPRLGALIGRVAGSVADYLRASAAALAAREGPPSFDGVEAALDRYAAEVAAIRGEGLTRGWSSDAVERLFALGFTLEHMRRNLGDLARCVSELARGSAP
jgi:uncharacterized membrane protein YccC